jgi:phage terminase large subunit GpA-like protein
MSSRKRDEDEADWTAGLFEDVPDGVDQGELGLAFAEERAERDRVMRDSVEGAVTAAMAVFEPPPTLTVSQWSDQFARLSAEDSAEPGRFVTARAEYQREIMDAYNDPLADTVVVMSSAQVGKTQIFKNIIGYIMHQDPCPVLLMQPTKEMAEAFSEDRLDPMIRDTPALLPLVSENKSRSGKNKKLRKSFLGGQITLVGANAPAGLASRPIRAVLADEVDRYPLSAGGEGDPLSLAVKRTTTFWNRKKLFFSTPTIKRHSRIEAAYEGSDKRQWFVCCPDCKHDQTMKWSGVRWEKGPDGKDDPDTAVYVCEACGSVWSDFTRARVALAGKWKATAPFRGVIGFHLNQLISPWVTLAECVREFLEAKRTGIQSLKVWTNTVLGETWEEQGERIDDSELMARRVDYGDVAPADVVAVTAGVDVQGDRLEVERVGWGPNDQSWGLGKTVLWGDPTGPAVWKALDDLLLQPIAYEGGPPLKVMATAVDSQYLTQTVATYCRDRWGRRVWAIRGVPGPGKPIWPTKAGKRNKTKLPFFNVGVDAAKEVVYARLGVTDPNANGFCWFNMSYDEDHFDQLTSEEVRTVKRRGMPVRVWEKIPGRRRNEGLDVRVYALAALEGLKMMGLKIAGSEAQPSGSRRARPFKAKESEAAPEPAQTPPPPPPAAVRRKKGRRIVGGML